MTTSGLLRKAMPGTGATQKSIPFVVGHVRDYERVGSVIPAVDEGADLGVEVLDGLEHSAADGPTLDDAAPGRGDGIELFNPATIPIRRYRSGPKRPQPVGRHCLNKLDGRDHGEHVAVRAARRVRRAAWETDRVGVRRLDHVPCFSAAVALM